jgi:DNA-binding MarR family transcriptional regulator
LTRREAPNYVTRPEDFTGDPKVATLSRRIHVYERALTPAQVTILMVLHEEKHLDMPGITRMTGLPVGVMSPILYKWREDGLVKRDSKEWHSTWSLAGRGVELVERISRNPRGFLRANMVYTAQLLSTLPDDAISHFSSEFERLTKKLRKSIPRA